MKMLKSFRLGKPADVTVTNEPLTENDSPINAEIHGSGVTEDAPTRRRVRAHWTKLTVYGVLPAIAFLLAVGAGFLKWQDASTRDGQAAAQESVRAATDGTVALLSYRPDTVQHDLEAAQGKLTGSFLDAYTKLTHDVVIPGAQQKQISAVATVPGASSTSATNTHAVVLLFVNQTTTIGNGTPSNTASTVRVTLDRVDSRWLISQFDPL